jgi:hypothetical protein
MVGPVRIVGDDHAGIAERAEVLRGIKAEAAHRTQGAGALAEVLGADGLGGVLDQRQIVTLRDMPQGIHVHALAKQMHRHDGPRPWRDLVLYLQRIEVVSNRIDVGEDGSCACAADRADRCEKRERRHDHFIAGADAQCLHRQQ